MTLLARIVWSVMAGAVVGGGVGAVLVVGAPATPAAAHANLLGSVPEDGTVLTAAPDQVVLTFSEPVRLIPERIVVVGPAGVPVETGDPTTDGPDLVIPINQEPDEKGTYLVSYRAVSQDSHPVGGSITFSLGQPSEVPELSADPDVGDPLVSAAVSINKYVGYAGVVLVLGPALMLAMLWPHRLPRRGAARLLWCGMGLITLSTLAGPLLQAPYTTGTTLFGAGMGDVLAVLASPYGSAHMVRLGVLTAVALLVLPLLAGRASRSDLLLLGGLAVVGLGTWPMAGHAFSSPVPIVSVVVDTLHLAAAAFWVGGLVVLAGFLLRLANERELSAILPEWSRWAALSVAVLMVAGLVMAVVEIGPPDALFTTAYGRLLLVKLGLVVVVIGVASYSRRLVRTRLGASRPGPMRLAVAAEALVLAAVLGMSSVLVQTTPGRTEVAAQDRQVATGYYAETLDSELYSLEVQVRPAGRGDNQVHLYAYTPDGDPQPVEEWQATAELPSAGIEPFEIPLEVFTDNHAIAEQVTLPVAGDWKLRFTLRVSEIDQESVEATVTIR